MDEDETVDGKISAIVTSPDAIVEDVSESIHSRLKDALKNIPDEGFEYSEAELKEITKKFKSYDTIKKEFEELNMNVKSDFQLMTELFEKYETIKGKPEPNEYRSLFEDLEYLLHQIDNANDFVIAGGLEKIILPNLGNQTVPELRIHSVKLLGILVQNNPKGQIAVFEKNVGSILLQSLSQTSGPISTNELSSILFAIGGLLRKFPLAQLELLSNPGLKTLVDLLGKPVDYKIKMKCLLLINDLIGEFDEVTRADDFDKMMQYNATDIKSRLLTTDYCTIVIELMTVYRQDFLDSLYSADDIVNVLTTSREICQRQWSESSIFKHTLLALKSNYDQQKDETNYDKAELDGMVEKLNRLHAFFSNHTVLRDEL